MLAGVCADPPCGYRLLAAGPAPHLDVPAGTVFPGRLLLTGPGDRYVVVAEVRGGATGAVGSARSAGGGGS